MKKYFLMLLAVFMLAGSAMAKELEYTINPVVNIATFQDADTTTGVGLGGAVKNVVVDGVGLGAEVSYFDLGKADLYRVPVTVGYDFNVKDNVTVTPKLGLLVDTLDKDGADTTTDVGFTLGSDVAFKVTENLDIKTGVAYNFNEVDDVNLDGFTFTGGVAYQF